MTSLRRLFVLGLLLGVGVLMSPVCGGGGAGLNLEAGNFQLIRKQRVSRFEFDFTYRVDMTNTGAPPRYGVTSEVTSASPNTVLVDAYLTFGDVPGNSSVTSADTFTVRQDRRFLLDLDALGFQIRVNGPGTIPPDPADVAPKLDRTIATTVSDATAFLYTGPDAIQTGVAPGTIETVRVAVLRGTVHDVAGDPIAGACVSIVSHPEYGETFTRADGMFDIAVNGGSQATVRIEKDGFFPAQRQVETVWQDWRFASPVVLVQPDPQVTVIDLAAATGMEVARGSVVTDVDGTRQATLLFPASTQATAHLPGGTTQGLSTISVRATEYTVGDSGQDAMPAELPPSSLYTYAAEFSIDEAQALNAEHVTFSQPVISYMENFLALPTGTDVPVASYDREAASWIPKPNGRIVEILGVGGGVASLDIDGTGSPATGSELAALGITTAERTQLASLYGVGATLWRSALTSFSPIDFNYPWVTDAEAKAPEQPQSDPAPDENVCEAPGSIIECQNQILGESIPIVGTPFTLNYRSSRVRGHLASRTLGISLSGATLPGSPTAISIEVQIAGQRHLTVFDSPPLTNLDHVFTWDGKDAYGRELQGLQTASVQICNRYPVFLGTPEAILAFGRPVRNVNPIGEARARFAPLCQSFTVDIPVLDARALGFGGWTLSEHHVYEPTTRRLLLGTGERRTSGDVPIQVLETARDGIGSLSAVLAHPDGSYYYNTQQATVRRISPSGVHSVFAGGGNPPDGLGDGGPATSAKLLDPEQLALGPDGSLYIADTSNQRIRRIASDGTISTVAGSGAIGFNSGGFSGDDGPATSALLLNPEGVAVAPDGTIFIADTSNHRVRRVGPNGTITTYAGTGVKGESASGIPAVDARLDTPSRLALGPDGTLYVSCEDNVRAISPDGTLRRFAGQQTKGTFTSDGANATSTPLNRPRGLSVTPEGDVVIANTGSHSIHIVRRGIITAIAGINGTFCNNPAEVNCPANGAAGTTVGLNLPRDVSVAPDGTVLIAVTGNNRILRLSPSLPNLQLGQALIPAEDGSEVYIFDITGRHFETRHALTGATLWSFAYDATGRLTAATDAYGNVTTIERDPDGDPLAIVGPFGSRTELALDFDGYLQRITNPAGESRLFDYDPNGLMIEHIDPRGHATTFVYDDSGRLFRDEGPEGDLQELVRPPPLSNGFEVTKTTALGRTTTYRTTTSNSGDRTLAIIFPAGEQATILNEDDGRVTTTLPDGTITEQKLAPDSRWGMRAPLRSEFIVTTPGGLVRTRTRERTASLADPDDPLSLTQQSELTETNGRTSSLVYDASLREFTLTSAEGRAMRAWLSTAGELERFQLGNLEPMHLVRDAFGRVESIEQGTGAELRVRSFAYGADGFLHQVVDPLSRVFSMTPDAAGRVLQTDLPGARSILFGYDASGNLASLAPPGRPNHQFRYTANDELEEYDPPTSGLGDPRTIATYTLDREPAHVSFPGGDLLTYGFDGVGKLISSTLPRGVFTYSYDSFTGQAASATSPEGVTVTYAWDGRLPISETWSGEASGMVERIFDSDFRLQELRVNGSLNAAYTYDNDGLIIGAGAMAVGRHPSHGLVTSTALGGVDTTIAYNDFGEPSTDQARFEGTPFYTNTYTRDPLGRIVRKVETLQGVTTTYDYVYDAAGRVEEVRENGNLARSYSYDLNGNRLSRTAGGSTTAATYDVQDRLLSSGAVTYAHTPSGFIASRTDASTGATTVYDYDTLGNLMRVDLPDGRVVGYVIDGVGRRVGKKLNGSLARQWLYGDHYNPVAELDGAGNVLARFVYLPGRQTPHYFVTGAGTYQVIADLLGSPRLIVDVSTGNILQRLDYDEYGIVTGDTNAGFQPIGFAGGLYDPDTGLVRFGARDYVAAIGRWAAPDPILFAGGSNLYAYVDNDPINFTDPSGLAWSLPPACPSCHPDPTPPPPKRPYDTQLCNAAMAIAGGVGSLCGPWWGICSAEGIIGVNYTLDECVPDPEPGGGAHYYPEPPLPDPAPCDSLGPPAPAPWGPLLPRTPAS